MIRSLHRLGRLACLRPSFVGSVLVLAGTQAGCAARRMDGGELVRSIHFDGNSSFIQGTSDYNLRQSMEQAPSSPFARWVPWAPTRALDREALARDAWRVEVWYAHHGFFDARFLGWDVRTIRPAGRVRRDGSQRAAVVELVGHVEEGPPTRVRTSVVEGMDRQVVGGPISSFARRISGDLVGDRFDLEAVKDVEEALLERLRQQAFAFATVRSAVEVVPGERVADIRFLVEAGPACSFGDVAVSGTRDVPRELVETEITIVPGTPFNARTLAETRQRLFALGAFSAVNVLPGTVGEREDGRPVVPVEVQVTETRFRQVRAGAGVGLESGRADTHVSLTFKHTNLLERLLNLKLDAQVGYAVVTTYDEVATGEAVDTRSPTLDLAATLVWPHAFGPRWKYVQDVGYEQGLEAEYRFLSPTVTPSVSFTASRRLTLTGAYRAQYFDYLDLDVQLSDKMESRLGLDLSDPYYLSFLEARAVFEGRDDVLFTRRGHYVTGAVGLAGLPGSGDWDTAVFGNFNYVRGSADVRMYRSLAPLFHSSEAFVVAGRLAAGVAVPYGGGDRASVPYAERFKVGGGATVRGWVSDHLGPYLCTVEDGDTVTYAAMAEGQDCDDYVYIGGLASGYGSLEVRKGIRWGVGVAGFVDGGMAWDGPADLLTQLPLLTAGGGIRYASPVGPVRLDVGFRLDDHPLYAQEPRWNAHFSLSEAF